MANRLHRRDCSALTLYASPHPSRLTGRQSDINDFPFPAAGALPDLPVGAADQIRTSRNLTSHSNYVKHSIGYRSFIQHALVSVSTINAWLTQTQYLSSTYNVEASFNSSSDSFIGKLLSAWLVPLRRIIDADRIERWNGTSCDFLGVLSDPHLLCAGW